MHTALNYFRIKRRWLHPCVPRAADVAALVHEARGSVEEWSVLVTERQVETRREFLKGGSVTLAGSIWALGASCLGVLTNSDGPM